MELPKEFFDVLEAFIERRALNLTHTEDGDYTNGDEIGVSTSGRFRVFAWYREDGSVVVQGIMFDAAPDTSSRTNALLAAFGYAGDITDLAQPGARWWLKVCGPLTAQAVRADRAQAIQRAISAARNSA